MKQPRYRPRYALKGQGLEDLYDVVDTTDDCIVSDAPKPWEDAAADARTRSAFADMKKLDEPPVNSWLSALNMPPFPGVSGVSARIWQKIGDTIDSAVMDAIVKGRGEAFGLVIESLPQSDLGFAPGTWVFRTVAEDEAE